MDVVRMIEDYRAQHQKEAALADDACKNVEVSFAAESVQVFSLKDMLEGKNGDGDC